MNPLTGAAPIIDTTGAYENSAHKKARYSPINTMGSPGLQINHQIQHIPGTFTPGQAMFNNGMTAMASPIHMGPMLQQGGLATPTIPGRMGGNALNVPQTPMGMMMGFGMASPFGMVSWNTLDREKDTADIQGLRGFSHHVTIHEPWCYDW